MSAHWIYDPNGYDWCLGAWKCSKCGTPNNNIGGGKDINPLIFRGSKFCPGVRRAHDRKYSRYN